MVHIGVDRARQRKRRPSSRLRQWECSGNQLRLTERIDRCALNETRCSWVCVSTDKNCDGYDDCTDGIDEMNCEDHVNPHVDCGVPAISPSLGNVRIVGGKVAIPGSWPWQATIHTDGGMQCGAAIIDEAWILTAAHCFKWTTAQKDWTVYVGKHHQDLPETTEQRRAVLDVFLHPEYDLNQVEPNPARVDRRNDLALMRLKKPVKYSNHVLPVCLPTQPLPMDDDSGIFYVTGFGETRDPKYGQVLKQAAVPIVSDAKCQELFPDRILHESMVCAGWPNGGHDACQGDSGGPLVKKSEHRWILGGIVSWGVDCGVANQPGVYTQVSYFIEWIRKTTGLPFK